MARTNAEIEAELQELTRKYRIMEGDRKSYAEQSQATIRKQKLTMEKLQADNDHLRQELLNYSRATSAKENSLIGHRISQLQEQADLLAKKLETERAKIGEMSRNKETFSTKIKEKLASSGGASMIKESNAAIDKQIRVLENRLDKALVKFNEALAVNRSLREDIDNLRQERVVFDGIYKKLERELHEKKKQMALVIEMSNVAYEERDNAQAELGGARQHSEKEMAMLDEEFKKMDKTLENDRRMKEFLKSKERAKSSRPQSQQAGADGTGLAANSSDEFERSPSRRRGRSQMNGASRSGLDTEASEKAMEYEQAFEKIKEATGIDDIDELVGRFVAAEDQNFSLFNYNNELNNEIERLEEQVAEIRTEMEKYKGEGASNDVQRKKVLKDLEDRLAKTESKAEQFETKAEDAVRILNELKSGIQSIFEKIGCSSDGIGDLLGNGGVTEANMMQYLGVIEQRTNELLGRRHTLLHQSIQSAMKQDDDLNATGGVGTSEVAASQAAVSPAAAAVGSPFPGPAAPMGSTQVSIVPPSTGDDFGEDDDDDFDDEERPLTRDELKMRTSRLISRREKKTNSGGNAASSSSSALNSQATPAGANKNRSPTKSHARR